MDICRPCSDGPGRLVRLEALRTPDGPLCAEHALELLRGYDRSRLLTIAAGGGPRSDADHAVVYCPLCGCNKSGDPGQANPRTEACEWGECLCHDESLPAAVGEPARPLGPGRLSPPRICLDCGSPDVREVERRGPSRGEHQVYYVDLRCLDCSWVEEDREGGI